jgi:hypothetical protein
VLLDDSGETLASFSFTGSGWGVVAVWLFNTWGDSVDLTSSAGFSVTYSSTAEFFIAMRPAHDWSGGHHYRAAFPATGGETQTVSVSFDAENWEQPDWAEAMEYAPDLADVQGFTITTFDPGNFEFHGLRIDGHSPPCD